MASLEPFSLAIFPKPKTCPGCPCAQLTYCSLTFDPIVAGKVNDNCPLRDIVLAPEVIEDPDLWTKINPSLEELK